MGKGMGLVIAGARLVLLILASGSVWCLYFYGMWPKPADEGSLRDEKPKISFAALALVLFLVTNSLLAQRPNAIQIEHLERRAVDSLVIGGVLFLCVLVTP